VATDKHLQHKAFQLFFDQAAAGRVVLQVIDKSDLDGAMFLADFSGDALLPDANANAQTASC
jgi:hypothetical protein